MKRHNNFYFTLLFLCSTQAYANSHCESKITLLYHERIPYVVNQNGAVIGLTATPASKAFRQSEVDIEWQKTPVKRQLMMIKNNHDCLCTIGWFKNPEREQYSRYSQPIYQDKPQVAITSANNQLLVSGRPLREVLQQQELSILMKDGYSYGKFIDEQVEKYQPTTYKVLYENLKMLSLIYHQRYDYFFIAPEEVDSLVEESKFNRSDFNVIEFNDMPEGEKRYILCSKQVPESVIHRLNNHIDE
ncbi:transporter substrate-binding domain-containing protein [Vibrio sp. S4M6]|uniref:transporter substrate-binding domain-containing protein n=1 Tax=Vibrio sinus TaxID=2946865 RepID=UPI00202A2C2B|nr:transporter substrate-binding domain-containing protein [Vibrio sinus]MCL9780764.1 transporter substrate-binding domain-containing protein [Vibrio sinus]